MFCSFSHFKIAFFKILFYHHDAFNRFIRLELYSQNAKQILPISKYQYRNALESGGVLFLSPLTHPWITETVDAGDAFFKIGNISGFAITS